ncbi:MAG: 4a-hydroxytetrahydrobiopterin dehydratase [bacterium]|nr:4a-hydroxytetrahydrobiopterin dehydratase [bacterium]
MEKPNILSEEQIEAGLVGVPGWEYKDNKISKEFKFKDFMDVLDFVNKLAPYCESIDHHPDIHIFYSKVLFELQRFDVGGKVTDKDFMVAKEIERIYSERPM